MQWSPGQIKALEIVSNWIKTKSSPFLYIAGYAGTGKTTLVKYFAQSIKGDVFYASFTGKAARVMDQKGCKGATTLHRLIYTPQNKSEKKLKDFSHQYKVALQQGQNEKATKLKELINEEKQPSFTLNYESPLKNASLLVLDECSMVSDELAKDVLFFKVPILVIGDPAQLPPVAGDGYFTSKKPDYVLTEVHRQARDSPVLRLATMIREGMQPTKEFMLHRQYLNKEELLSFDQVLVGKNITRRMVNTKMRALYGYNSKWPVAGDKLVCLKNDYTLGLLNGSILYVNKDAIESEDLQIDLTDEDTQEQNIFDVNKERFIQYDDLDYIDHRPYWKKNKLIDMDYAYALTVHKSQGSQWNKVLLCDDGFGWRNRRDRQKWLYTAITRAEEKIKIVTGF